MTLVLERAPERLTLEQQFRLIEIAHETNNSEIRCAAILLLREATRIVVAVEPDDLP